MTCMMPKNALMLWHTRRLSIVMPITNSRGHGRIILKGVLYMMQVICISIHIPLELRILELEVFARVVINDLVPKYPCK